MAGRAVGVDPGRHAAAAAIIERDIAGVWRVVRWCGWWGREGAWTWQAAGGGVVRVTHWCLLPEWMRDVVGGQPDAMEATPALLRHRAHSGAGVRSLVTQAEAAGALAHALLPRQRVEPDVWRREVLRVRGTDPHAARMAMGAWGMADVTRRLPLDWQGSWAVEQPPPQLAEHVCEAACIALWGARHDG